MATRTQENQTNSPLLRMPPEVRTEIYKYVLAGGLIEVRDGPSGCRPTVVGVRELLYTCRQIEYEAAPLVMSCCHFESGCSPYTFFQWPAGGEPHLYGGIQNYRVSRYMMRELGQIRYLGNPLPKPVKLWYPTIKRVFLDAGPRDRSRGWKSLSVGGLEKCFRDLFALPNLEV